HRCLLLYIFFVAFLLFRLLSVNRFFQTDPSLHAPSSQKINKRSRCFPKRQADDNIWYGFNDFQPPYKDRKYIENICKRHGPAAHKDSGKQPEQRQKEAACRYLYLIDKE